MLDKMLFLITFATTLGSGLMAGLYFAFSTSVVTALSNISTSQGITAMQSINISILNRWFKSIFFGTALGSIILLGSSVLSWGEEGSISLMVGSVFYLMGSLLITMMYNVPLNNFLADIEPENEKSIHQWGTYKLKWLAWNHLRTLITFLAMLSFMINLI